MSDLTAKLREVAREALESKRVEYVIGYETGSDGVNARPFFAYDAAETDRLVFDATCTNSLTKYLTEADRRGKSIGIVLKPCDARSLNVLTEEKQFARDKIFAIGVVCPGMVARTRDGGDGLSLQARCQVCEQHVPVTSDVLIGEPAAERKVDNAYPRLAEFEQKTEEEKADFWAAEFEKCLRCYACRQACPQCYCSDCFAEMLDPEWVGVRIGQTEAWMFHTIRAFHLAGRCVGCDECERACPVGIPLGLLNGKLRQEVNDVFEYQAGASGEQPPPLETFRKDEKLGVGQ